MNRRIHVVTARVLTATRRARLSAISFAALLVFNGAMAGARAADGDLDPSFGKGGKVTTHFSLDDRVNAVAVQPDGKIVAAGAVSGAQSSDIALARYNRDGSLDSTFGDNGKTTTDFSNLYDEAFDVIIQPDGKIVAAGTHNVGLSVVRYNSDGSLDNSFGSGGKVTANFGVSTSGQAAALQPDGKIIVVGRVFTFDFLPATNNFFSARFNPDGSIDASFGAGGKVITDFFSGSDDIATAVCLQPDGKIIAAGHTVSFAVGVTVGEEFAVVRYNGDGSLDTSFGSGGKVVTDVAVSLDFAHGAAIQDDGKIILAGAARFFVGGLDFGIVRYNPNGSLDNSFGSGGRVTTDFSTGTDEARGVIIDDIGRIIAAGFTHLSTKTSFAVARYKHDGGLDPTFGDGGRVTTDIPSEATPEEFEAEAHAVAIQADGKIVAAGRRHSSVTTGDDFALVRYLSASYDFCLQDDGGGEFLQFNSTTGDYRFTSCSGFTMSGTGVLDRRGANLTLRHNAGDRRLLVTVNTVVNRGTASIQALSQGLRLAITDRNIANNSCACE